MKIKKQKALADAFFCYDYYNCRLEEVAKKNKNLQNKNLENVILQEAIENILLINNNTLLTDQQKKKERAVFFPLAFTGNPSKTLCPVKETQS